MKDVRDSLTPPESSALPTDFGILMVGSFGADYIATRASKNEIIFATIS
jgi:hypothetical protein